MLESLVLTRPLYLVADSYYAAAKVIRPLLKANQHLITSVRLNAVAYNLPPSLLVPRRGRPRLAGCRVKLNRFFTRSNRRGFCPATSPIYGEKNVTLHYRCRDLYWKSAGRVVRFVWVIHPSRGQKILLSSDCSLSALQIIELYGVRFKIEFCFKQAIHVLGTYAYHFWLSSLSPKRQRRGNHYLAHHPHTQQILRKIHAYHVFIQMGFIAQGILHALALNLTGVVWESFGSWIRTKRPGIVPSEFVVTLALRSTFPAFLADSSHHAIFTKFLRPRIDPHRLEGLRLIS